MLYYENFNLTDVITPVNASKLEQLLIDSKYDSNETTFLVNGFKNGFPLGYAGPKMQK